MNAFPSFGPSPSPEQLPFEGAVVDRLGDVVHLDALRPSHTSNRARYLERAVVSSPDKLNGVTLLVTSSTIADLAASSTHAKCPLKLDTQLRESRPTSPSDGPRPAPSPGFPSDWPTAGNSYQPLPL